MHRYRSVQCFPVTPLDCEALDLLYGFDFTYRGNHNALIAEALGVSPALEPLMDIPGTTVINCEPTLTIALDDDCRLQFRVSLETRTNAYQVRTSDFPEEQLSVYVTARQYGSLSPDKTYVETLHRLQQICEEMIDRHVVERVLDPAARFRYRFAEPGSIGEDCAGSFVVPPLGGGSIEKPAEVGGNGCKTGTVLNPRSPGTVQNGRILLCNFRRFRVITPNAKAPKEQRRLSSVPLARESKLHHSYHHHLGRRRLSSKAVHVVRENYLANRVAGIRVRCPRGHLGHLPRPRSSPPDRSIHALPFAIAFPKAEGDKVHAIRLYMQHTGTGPETCPQSASSSNMVHGLVVKIACILFSPDACVVGPADADVRGGGAKRLV